MARRVMRSPGNAARPIIKRSNNGGLIPVGWLTPGQACLAQVIPALFDERHGPALRRHANGYDPREVSSLKKDGEYV